MEQAFLQALQPGCTVRHDNKYGQLLQAWSQARIATAVGEHDVHHV